MIDEDDLAKGIARKTSAIVDFSKEEVSRLEKRSHKLDLDRSGSISIGEFVSDPELKENPLVKRVVDIFDSDLNGEVDRDTVSQILQKSAISRTKRSAEKECLVVSIFFN